MIHSYNKKQAVRPASADEVTVTLEDGSEADLSTPIAVDSNGVVSFAIDDDGVANLRVLVVVQKAGGGASSTDVVTFGHPTIEFDHLPEPTTGDAGKVPAVNEGEDGYELAVPVTDAAGIAYDHTASGLVATDTQAAIDELKVLIDGLAP